MTTAPPELYVDPDMSLPRDDAAPDRPSARDVRGGRGTGATPIDQGEGATVWTGEESQQEHPAIVIAPQYTSVVVEDDYNPSDYPDITVDLVETVAEGYAVDENRIYNTGQSMGAMMTLGMDLEHPDLFAASYVVAGQWPAEDADFLTLD